MIHFLRWSALAFAYFICAIAALWAIGALYFDLPWTALRGVASIILASAFVSGSLSPLDKRTKIKPDNARERGIDSTPEYAERLTNAVEACADRIEQHQRQIADQNQAPIDYPMETKDSDSSKSLDNFRELLRAIKELQVLIT